jgi:hypothetical protein
LTVTVSNITAEEAAMTEFAGSIRPEPRQAFFDALRARYDSDDPVPLRDVLNDERLSKLAQVAVGFPADVAIITLSRRSERNRRIAQLLSEWPCHA